MNDNSKYEVKCPHCGALNFLRDSTDTWDEDTNWNCGYWKVYFTCKKCNNAFGARLYFDITITDCFPYA